MTLHFKDTLGQAPFQIQSTLDLSDLPAGDRKKLKDALRLQIALMEHSPWAGFNDESFTVMDLTADHRKQFNDVLARFEGRHEIEAEVYTLPTIPLKARLLNWLSPKHEAPVALKRLGNVCKVNGRYQFEVELHSTESDVQFLKTLKLVCKSSTCKGSSYTLRGNLLTVSAKRPGTIQVVWSCVQKISFDKVGSAAAICPGKLWLYTLLPVWQLDEAVC